MTIYPFYAKLMNTLSLELEGEMKAAWRIQKKKKKKIREVLCVLQAVRQDRAISLFSCGMVEFGFR